MLVYAYAAGLSKMQLNIASSAEGLIRSKIWEGLAETVLTVTRVCMHVHVYIDACDVSMYCSTHFLLGNL